MRRGEMDRLKRRSPAPEATSSGCFAGVPTPAEVKFRGGFTRRGFPRLKICGGRGESDFRTSSARLSHACLRLAQPTARASTRRGEPRSDSAGVPSSFGLRNFDREDFPAKEGRVRIWLGNFCLRAVWGAIFKRSWQTQL